MIVLDEFADGPSQMVLPQRNDSVEALVLDGSYEPLCVHGWTLEWADIVRDLDHLDETTITVDGKHYVIRSQIKGTLGTLFQAAGVAIPPALRPA